MWKCIKSHRTQENWKPGIETASLWVRVDETHEGTIDDPIPFKIPMEIFINKYYIEDGITYKCIRDSGIALNNTLNSLVNIYVEKI